MTRCGSWAAGAVYSVPGAYYPAGVALLAKLGQPAATNALAILGFNLIMFALIELPLLGFVLAPDRTRLLTEKLNGWMTDHRRTLIMNRGRSRRHLPAHLGAVRPRLNAAITPPSESPRHTQLEGLRLALGGLMTRAGFEHCATLRSAAARSQHSP